jgi:CBS domain-containing protein
MQLSEIMTFNPVVLSPNTMLREAAQKMRELDSGVMPVGENDRLVGMLTDRDITVRATADGRDPNTTPVRDVMTSDVIYCYADHDIEMAARTMAENQIRRVIVLDRDKRLVGIASLGDLALHAPSERLAGEVTEVVSEPS